MSSCKARRPRCIINSGKEKPEKWLLVYSSLSEEAFSDEVAFLPLQPVPYPSKLIVCICFGKTHNICLYCNPLLDILVTGSSKISKLLKNKSNTIPPLKACSSVKSHCLRKPGRGERWGSADFLQTFTI